MNPKSPDTSGKRAKPQLRELAADFSVIYVLIFIIEIPIINLTFYSSNRRKNVR